MSADNLCEQSRPRPGLANCQAWSGFWLFYGLPEIFLKILILKKFSRRQKIKRARLPIMQRVKAAWTCYKMSVDNTIIQFHSCACWIQMNISHNKKSYFSSAENLKQTNWTQIRPDKMSGMIRIQTVWHSDAIHHRQFGEVIFEINRQTTWIMQNFPACKMPSYPAVVLDVLFWTDFSFTSELCEVLVRLCRLADCWSHQLFTSWVILHAFFVNFFKKFFQVECQTVKIQIRKPDISSDSIWIQIVC